MTSFYSISIIYWHIQIFSLQFMDSFPFWLLLSMPKNIVERGSCSIVVLSYDLSGSEISWSHSVVNNWTNRFQLNGAKIVRILGLRILCECLQIIIVSANIQLAEVEFVWWRAAAGDSSRHPAGVQTLHPRQIHHRQPQWQVASIMSSIYWLLWMLIRHT